MTTTKKKRRNCPEDFKRKAIALVKEQGYTKAAAARSLCINPNMIGRWQREFEEQDAPGLYG